MDTWLRAIEAEWEQQHRDGTITGGGLFGLGYIASERSEWVVADSLLTQVTTLLPDDPQAYRVLGFVYLVNGPFEKFEPTLEAGIEAAKVQHDLEQELRIQGNLGWILYTRKGNLTRSEALLTAALEQSRLLAIEAAEGFNQYRLASILNRKYRYDEALVLLDAAEVRYLKYRPRQYPHVLVLRGTVLKNLYRFSDAERELEKAIAEAEARDNMGVKVHALTTLAQLRYEMGRYGAAREAGLDVLSLAHETGRSSSEIVVRIVLGEIERRWGNLEAAATNFEQGVALAKETGNWARLQDVARELGLTALDLQDANAAREHFEALLTSLQDTGDSAGLARAYLGLGRTYTQFHNTEEALRNYDLALAQLGDGDYVRLRAEVLIAKAAALILTGVFEEAATLLAQARDAEPGNRNLAYEVEIGLGDVYLAQEHFAEALEHFREAEAIERQLPHPSIHWYVLFGKALAHWHLGEIREAERAFRGAVGIIEALRENLNSSTNRSYFVQNKVQVYEHFATFQEEQGDTERRVVLYRMGTESDPRRFALYYAAGAGERCAARPRTKSSKRIGACVPSRRKYLPILLLREEKVLGLSDDAGFTASSRIRCSRLALSGVAEQSLYRAIPLYLQSAST